MFRPSKTFEYDIIKYLEAIRLQNYKYNKKQNLKNKIGELAYLIRPNNIFRPNKTFEYFMINI